ncbi:MAG: hypothetical protein PF590_07350 [Candidatus Delongbacteria bacterium]|nr:hypothetical protein [Candidatus Delongbacteria bacterium]
MLNGKEFHIEKYKIDTSESMFYYKLKLPSGKLKTRSLKLDKAFSVTDSTNKEHVLYVLVDSSNNLSVNQMRHYVEGYRIARKEYDPWWAMAGGFAVGAGGMMVSKNPFLSLFIPIAYVGGTALLKPNKNRIIWKYPEFEGEEDFFYAYQRSARYKNMKYAIIGSLEGIVVGVIIGVLTGYYN